MAKKKPLELQYRLPSRIHKKRERIFEIDFIRGLAILLMILLHGCFCIGDINNLSFFVAPEGGVEWINAVALFGHDAFAKIDYGDLFFLEFFFSSMFMFLAGISTSFSRNNWERATKLALFGAVMTVFVECISGIFGLGFHIYIGILQSLSIALLLYALIDTFFPSYWVDFGIGILFSVLFLLSVYNWAEPTHMLTGPRQLNTDEYPLPLHLYRLLFGMNAKGDDYFSPLLTILMVFYGAVFGKTLYRKKKSILPASLPKKWAAPIVWLGNHSLYVYILHTPAIYLILFLIALPFGYRFHF